MIGWLKAATATAVATVLHAAYGQAVISQVYTAGGSTGATYKNDFIELFNRGTSPVDLTGWTLQYASATGVAWTRAFLPTAVIPPGGYFLIQFGGGPNGEALPTPDFAVSSFVIAAFSGKIALGSSTATLPNIACPSEPTIVDLLGYGAADCSESSPAASPAATTALTRKSAGCTDSQSNAADFDVLPVAPRNSASLLHSCGGVPMGACCLPDYTCQVTSGAQCAVLGGAYKGDSRPCGGVNPCSAPPGACCRASTCTTELEVDCVAGAGVWQGANTTCATPCNPPCLTLAAARAEQLGRYVRLCNVIVASTTDLVFNTSYRSFTVQDATGGITVFGTNADLDLLLGSFVEGDRITLEGKLDGFNGLLELVAPFTGVTNHAHAGIPAPVEIGAPDLADGSPTAEGLESRLVTLRGVTFFATGDFANSSYTVRDSQSRPATVRVATSELDLIGRPIPAGPVDITGVFSQYDLDSPYTAGYQLQPRRMSDLVPVGVLTGACCLGAGCQVLTPADCASGGGTYKGDGVTCTPDPCTCRGDTNCDGVVSFKDINPFVAILSGVTPCRAANADCNNDGQINFKDINAFVALLSGGATCN
jgi:hypothetical protein